MMLFIVLLFLAMSWWMRCYTNHGDAYTVENYMDMKVDDAIKKIDKGGFRYVLTDSVFIIDKEPGIVLDQNPKLGEQVKEGRRIYLTISKSNPDEVSLPSLVGNYDYEQYVKKLKLLNLRATVKEQVFSNKLEPNSILYMYYGDEKITQSDINDGVKIPMGAVLEFVVTTRTGGKVEIPNLICKTYSEAEFLITASGLKLGAVSGVPGSDDLDNTYVTSQFPDFVADAMVPLGSTVDLTLSETRPTACD
ncbi:MAG: PASTA domain-containing protein [Saprospiraceae bacterium]|nr:PASTA domain-containing protein [Saprospiraceae bacterium]